ncbi:MAG TPA: hypothetical protein VJO13_10165 [Ktedonobacterales bacterium]|nr:hypothetical protein [Ktedonobacterales bacterium]
MHCNPPGQYVGVISDAPRRALAILPEQPTQALRLIAARMPQLLMVSGADRQRCAHESGVMVTRRPAVRYV